MQKGTKLEETQVSKQQKEEAHNGNGMWGRIKGAHVSESSNLDKETWPQWLQLTPT